jgi:hypothetical protein
MWWNISDKSSQLFFKYLSGSTPSRYDGETSGSVHRMMQGASPGVVPSSIEGDQDVVRIRQKMGKALPSKVW